MSRRPGQLFKYGGFLTFVLLALLNLAGQTPAPPTSSGTITGRVVNESGRPLANARIMIASIGFPQQGVSTTSDRDGRFQASGLESRSYRVFASLSAYAPDIPSKIYHVGDSVTLVLTKGGVITGNVMTSTGEPVVGVHVHARMLNADSSWLAFRYDAFPAERPTDDRGVYRLYGLRAGTYVVWAGRFGPNSARNVDPFDEFVPTYSPGSSLDTAAEITVRAGEEVSNVDIRFRGEPGHIVSGRINPARNAQPFQNVVVSLTDASKTTFTRGMSTAQSDDGFIFRGVDDGDYILSGVSYSQEGLSGEIATKRIRVSGADLTGIELTAELLASVSGRIVLDETSKSECSARKQPLFTETLISALPDENRATSYDPQFQFFLKSPVSVDTEGNILFKNLAPGRYFFYPEFTAKHWYLQSITFPPVTKTSRTPAPVDATRSWTTLKAGDRLSGLRIVLAQGAASLTGQVTEEAGGDLFLYLVPAEKERAEDALRFFGVALGPDGKASLESLPPGRYWVLVKSSSEGGLVTKRLRMPDQKELRATLLREAEAAKTAIELKPCQSLSNLELKLNQ